MKRIFVVLTEVALVLYLNVQLTADCNVIFCKFFGNMYKLEEVVDLSESRILYYLKPLDC